VHTGFWVGKPVGKRPLGRPRRRWEDNIKIDLYEMGCGGRRLDCPGSVYEQVAGTRVNAVINPYFA
jgi:hypothetical protein